MRQTYDRRTTRSPWLGVPVARTGYDRSARSFIQPLDWVVTLVLVVVAAKVHVGGDPVGFAWPLVIWVPIWACLLAYRRHVTERWCDEHGHVPYYPFDSLDVVFCGRCDRQLRDEDWEYVSPEVADAVAEAVTEVDAAREGDEPQARWSDRR